MYFIQCRFEGQGEASFLWMWGPSFYAMLCLRVSASRAQIPSFSRLHRIGSFPSAGLRFDSFTLIPSNYTSSRWFPHYSTCSVLNVTLLGFPWVRGVHHRPSSCLKLTFSLTLVSFFGYYSGECKRKLMLFVPTRISIKLNLTVPSYQWQATSKVSSLESLHGSVCTVHALFMCFIQQVIAVRRLIMLIGVLSKKFLSRYESSCSLGVKQGLHNNIRRYYLSPTTKLPIHHLTHHYATIFQWAETTATTTTTRQSFRSMIIDPSIAHSNLLECCENNS